MERANNITSGGSFLSGGVGVMGIGKNWFDGGDGHGIDLLRCSDVGPPAARRCPAGLLTAPAVNDALRSCTRLGIRFDGSSGFCQFITSLAYLNHQPNLWHGGCFLSTRLPCIGSRNRAG